MLGSSATNQSAVMDNEDPVFSGSAGRTSRDASRSSRVTNNTPIRAQGLQGGSGLRLPPQRMPQAQPSVLLTPGCSLSRTYIGFYR